MNDIETRELAFQPIGRIAAALPGSAGVFRKHKLDFCCRGDATLAAAATGRGLDVATIESELRALAAPASGVPEPTPALIDHILARYHETHRRELPELIALAKRVERVHAGHADVPAGLADFLAALQAELDGHMMKEERMLFPMMKAGGHPAIGMPIACMRGEHIEHGGNLARLSALTRDHTPPDGACNSWRALYAGTCKLEADLMEHIHLENNVLFERFGV